MSTLRLCLFSCFCCHIGAKLTLPKNKNIKPPHIEVVEDDLKPLQYMYVSELHKLTFCPIEKIASSQFRQLFYRISGDDLWFEPPYFKDHLPVITDYPLERITEIMNDPSWVKAVFFRDPVKRLLSSYLHLLLNPTTPARYRKFLREVQKNVSWPNFVTAVTQERDGWNNVHWQRQTDFCNLRKFWPIFNFVGNYERLAAHSRMLSTTAKLDNYTANGWDITKRFKDPIKKHMPKHDRKRMYMWKNMSFDNFGQGDCMWCSNRAPHKNDYSRSSVRVDNKTWKQIRFSEVYRPDYDIFEKIIAAPFSSRLYTQKTKSAKSEFSAK